MRKRRSDFLALVFAVLATGMLCGGKTLAQEKSPKEVAVDQPTVLIATSNVERFLSRVLYLMRAVEQNEIGGMASMMVNMYSRGLDRNRPIAVAMTINASGNPDPAVLLPISDLKGFFAGLTAFGEPEDLGNGLFTLEIAGRPVFMKQRNDWLVVSQQEEIVENFKTIPEELIKGLANDYEIGVRLDAKSIPAEQLETLFGMMKESFDRTALQQQATLERRLERAKAQSSDRQDIKAMEDELASLKAGLEFQRMQSAELEKSLKSISQVIVGLYVDPSDKHVGFDVAVDFIPGSAYATRLQKTSKTPSRMTELPAKDSAIVLHATESWDAEQISMYARSAEMFFAVGFERLLKDAEIELDKSIKSELQQIVLESIRSGVSDSGLTINFNGGLSIVVGAHVADGKKIEALVKKIAGSVDSKVGLETKFNAYKFQDADIHLGSIPIPDANDSVLRKMFEETPLAEAAPLLSKILGENLQFAVATSETGFYAAIGPGAEDNLKAALDRVAGKSSVPQRPMELRIETLPIFQFAQSVSSNAITDAMAKAAQNMSEADLIVVDTRITENVVVWRLSIEEGVLRAIGAAIKTGTKKQRGGF
jgi:hypothetical protein